MTRALFLRGREHELRQSLHHLDHDILRQAACRGMDTRAYFPDEGEPVARALTLCGHCEARLSCLALALRTEEPDARHGWFGGLGPDERASIAAALGVGSTPVLPEPAALAIRLRGQGRTIADIAAELGCSRRTVLRYLRRAA